MRFAFVIHPFEAKDVARKYAIAKYMPDAWIEAFLLRKSPVMVSDITGVRSVTGEETSGFFVGLPLTPRQMMKTVPIELVNERIYQCCELAHKHGAEIIGLGAFSAVVGDGGVTVSKRSPIAVTTGNSYTVATAIEGLEKACDLVGIHEEESTIAIVGATGSIGKTCARILSKKFAKTIVVGRDPARTQAIGEEVQAVLATTDVSQIKDADAVITVTSSETPIIDPTFLKQGAIVCDVSRPRNVSAKVAAVRPDVLVIEGGVVKVPGDAKFNFDFGFPPGTAFACMSETMILALENRPESYTLGKDVSVAQVDEMRQLAAKHGFELAGFRAFEHAVTSEAINRTKQARLELAIP